MTKQTDRLWTRSFISISVSNFFLFMTFYFLLVTLPVFVLEELAGTESEAGLVTTVFLLSAIIIRPLAGMWMEKAGGRKILLASLVLFAGASLFYLWVDTLTGLFIVRFLHGIGFGMATTATGGLVAGIVPDSRRGEGMGYFVLSTNLAMVMGPFLGLTAMRELGMSAMLAMGAVSAFIGFAAGLFVSVTEHRGESKRNVHTGLHFRDLFEVKAIPIALTGAFFAIVYSSLLSFVSIHAEEVGLGHVSSLFFVVYAAILLVSRPYTGKWFDIYGANVIVYPAIVLFAIGMLMLGSNDSAVIFLVAAGFAGLGWGTLFPSFQTIAIMAAAPRRRATATATFLSIYDIGIGLGSFLVGLAATKVSMGTIYSYSSIYILAGLLVYFFMQGGKIHREEKREAG